MALVCVWVLVVVVVVPCVVLGAPTVVAVCLAEGGGTFAVAPPVLIITGGSFTGVEQTKPVGSWPLNGSSTRKESSRRSSVEDLKVLSRVWFVGSSIRVRSGELASSKT